VTNKEKEAEEAEKRKNKNRANELRQMGPEDYLFGYIMMQNSKKRINQTEKQTNPKMLSGLQAYG